MTPPVVLRPRRLRITCWLAAAALVLVFGVLAVLLPARQTGTDVAFGTADQVAFFCIGLLLAAAAVPFTRVRVIADDQGLRVRNYLVEKELPWAVVAAVRMDDGSPWASLDLQDDVTVALLAIQANDGARAVDAVLALRRLLAGARAD